MPELTQGMMDAGAVTFDPNGVPVTSDGTPIAGWGYEGVDIGGGEGLLERIQRQFSQIPLSDTPAPAFSELPAVGEGAFYDNPTAFKPRAPDAGSGYPAIFGLGAPPAGWFTLDDYYSMINPQPTVDTPNGVPSRFTAGSFMQSTNDWRLLPEGFNDPNYFMINGEVIDRRMIGQSTARSQFGDPPGTGYNSGAAIGYPIAFTNPGWQGTTGFGYPGSISGWHMGPSTGIT